MQFTIHIAWIGSTSLGTTYFFCAPVSVLVDLFGPIRVGVIGSVLSFVGVLASALILQSKYLMRVHFLTYGFLFGVGQSLVLGSLFSILPHYFNKKLVSTTYTCVSSFCRSNSFKHKTFKLEKNQITLRASPMA